MDTNLIDLSQTVWNKVLDHVEDGVVFIDSLAGECLHWSVGTETLLQRGAAAIREFNAYKYFQGGTIADIRKAIFITGSSLSSIQVDLCDILSQSSFMTVLLVTVPMSDPSSVIPRLRRDMLQWMSIKIGNVKGMSADVFCFPFYAPLTETFVMFPPFRDVFTPLDLSKVKSFGQKTDSLTIKDQITAQQLAAYLDSFLGQIGLADVVFSVGALSNCVATALEELPSAHHRRKVAPHRVSVVIVDRTLDLCSPVSVDSKCFLDKMLFALPHLADHSNDIAVNMSQLAQVTVDSAKDEALFPGCLAHQDHVCKNAVEWLIHKKDRDILLNLHQVLKSKLSPGVKFATRVKPEALEKDVRQFRGNIEKIHENLGILQIALAAVQTLTGEHTEELELILSAERILRQNVYSSSEPNELAGLLPQVTKLLTERHIRGLTLDAILRLVILIYSLIGTDMVLPLKDEVQLQAAISTALFEDQEYPGLAHDILLPLEASKDKVDSVAAHVFAIFKAVALARRDQSKYKSLLKGQGQSMPAVYTSFLQQLMKDILDPSKPPIPDLSCKSTGLRDLLKSGFSILLNKQQVNATQHPSDQPNLLMFILGGITGEEMRFMQEAWMNSAHGKAGGSLVVASSRLLSPNDTLQAVLRSTPQPL